MTSRRELLQKCSSLLVRRSGCAISRKSRAATLARADGVVALTEHVPCEERCRFEAEPRKDQRVNIICRTSGAHASTTENPGLAPGATFSRRSAAPDWMRFAQYLGQLCLERRGWLRDFKKKPRVPRERRL